ncbi:glycoside hydrolase family 16 protein [Patellaria atrata CBS 101060]|uniref:chitinase n=1 Tax=Patellaria atrata CBS 101060 TaxID=1346257 RepID=A0A9P4VND1_9PEZI|nr:glycoside hydrolase family 16 protein [Patellaria atrata CBS 101060]
MRPFSLTTALLAGLSLLVSNAAAQTWTDCNPLERTDCPNMPALSTNMTFNLTEGKLFSRDLWNTTNGKIRDSDEGALFKIGGRGDSPTIQSKFYIFFGTVQVVMRAARGRGVISSIVLQSEDLDEIDWEFKGGDEEHVHTNYFGKGDSENFDRGEHHEVESPMDSFHNYTVNWNQDVLEWWINNKKVRTLKYSEASNGTRYPQTPVTVRLGIWVGGDPEVGNTNGTVEWAGGLTDYNEAPFTMTVASVYARDAHQAKEYRWGDKTGSWESIELIQGKSIVVDYQETPHGVKNRWNALPQAAQIGIICGTSGGALTILAFIAFCCIKQRRAGRREYAAAMAIQQREALEDAEHKRRMAADEGYSWAKQNESYRRI